MTACSYCGELTARKFCSDFCRFWSKVRYGPGCWEWQAGKDGDYGAFRVGERTIGAHVFVCDPAPGLCALHRCDNPPCVRPRHLWEGTRGQNNNDRKAKGREGDRRGRRNGRVKLTEAQVADILASNESGPTLAKRHGVGRVRISRIRRGKSWAQLRQLAT